MIAPDKIKHFMGGLLIAFMVGLAFSRDLDTISAALVGLTAAILIGVLKEAVWDNWLKRGTDDKYDMYATAIGGVCGSGLLALLLTHIKI